MLILGDLNARVRSELIEGIIGKHGVAEKSENGDSLLDLCDERGLVVGNTLFEHKDVIVVSVIFRLCIKYLLVTTAL